MIRIVIAEDDADWRRILSIQLSLDPELEVVGEGENGEQALTLCTELEPDAVFSDIDMPGKSGLELGEALRSLPGSPYLVFITGRQEHALKAFELRASDYLVKPVDDQRLAECIDRLKEYTSAKRQAELAPQLSQRISQLEQDCNTDPMLGTYNRRFMDARLQREGERSRRQSRPLSCIMMDMDCFKSVNDRYGHAMGDLVLVQLCETVRQVMGPEDVLARYGGEEFLVLLPDTSDYTASATAEKIRQAVEQREFGEDENRFRLTVSLGVAALTESESPEEMVERADQALYQAKTTGRNKWVCF